VLDVLCPVVERLLAAHRRRIGTPAPIARPGPVWQAVLVTALVWRRVLCALPGPRRGRLAGHRLPLPARGVDVLAEQAPELHDVLDRCHREGRRHLVLDGTLIESDRVAGTHLSADGRAVDTWYCGKPKAFGANVPALYEAVPTGFPF
jgi:hypothetical protein